MGELAIDRAAKEKQDKEHNIFAVDGGSAGVNFSKEEVENCRAARLFFFGSEYVFREHFGLEMIGPKEEVVSAWQKFSMMDDDRSGRVGIEEFRAVVVRM